MHNQWTGRRTSRRLIGVTTAVAFAVVVLLARSAAAGEIVPSLGLSNGVDGAGDSKLYTGLALRDQIAPLLKGEVALAYRSESRYDGELTVRSWPITTSLYLTPVPALYAGAGVGWYQTTFDYEHNLPGLPDETKQLFGVHLGGGVEVPAGPAAIDLNGRYVMLRDQQSRLVPEEFNPDFWTMSLGLALRF